MLAPFAGPPGGFRRPTLGEAVCAAPARRLPRPAAAAIAPPALSGRGFPGRIPAIHAAISVFIRLRLRARHTRSHSPRTLASPRTLNRRNPTASLIQPLGASDSHLRRA